MSFSRITVVGLGLIGSSVALAARARIAGIRVTGYDADPEVRRVAREIGLCDTIADDAADAAHDAELVVLCVPVGAMGRAAANLAPALPADAIVTDVGSCKASVVEALQAALPGHTLVPAHPVAGTEQSGPTAGFATLFNHRWCILTPPEGTDPAAVDRVAGFWRALGAEVETMAPDHHDRVLAVTSHLPHLIAYTIVGTASDLEEVTQSEVIKYSAGGFRDFTRIAASDPTMWRDVFLANREAVLDMLQRFSEDLALLQRAIRWGQGDALFDHFTQTRAIRRSIVEQGQDDARADFGRTHG
ncbi:cyclohexadienyl dehydrogenase [Sphingomonas spermidinifaciens]|uniref:prephenate dehydrogenase n=1 Tax=Sphingomonas spermidinifaciens TaxID=1141889 RepID=A0A2A4B340_9SPHN|nr:prephenate/arogenate dehydrogenase family protein [Sphingomonas spermidinifaciens]PCD02375.1 cyclohexadienyl dehydrogenase [Sphingomonas spermidinifaciens]